MLVFQLLSLFIVPLVHDIHVAKAKPIIASLAGAAGSRVVEEYSPHKIMERDMSLICSRVQTQHECESGTGFCEWDRVAGCRYDSDGNAMKKKCERPENDSQEKCENVSSHCDFDGGQCTKKTLQMYTGKTSARVEEICRKVPNEFADDCKRAYNYDCIWDTAANLAKCLNLSQGPNGPKIK